MYEARFSSSDELNRQVEIAKQLRSEFLYGHSEGLINSWRTAPKVIASIFGLAILGMAVMGAAA
jgi:hypothetical protein